MVRKTRKGKILSFFFFPTDSWSFYSRSKHGTTSHSIWFTNTNSTYTYLRLCLFAEARDMLTHQGWLRKRLLLQRYFLEAVLSVMMLCNWYKKIAFCERQFPFLYAAVLFPRKQNCSSRAELLIVLPGLCSTLLSQCCYPRVILCCVLVDFQ